MFDFEIVKYNREEAIRLVNKIIIDEINYINKLCFTYSLMKEKHPNVFKEDLKKLFIQLSKLSDLKREFSRSVENVSDVELNEKVSSLAELKSETENNLSDNIDEMINLLVEESEVNGIGMENTIGYLLEIDEMLFNSFISNMRDINDETINYIVRTIKKANKDVKGGR